MWVLVVDDTDDGRLRLTVILKMACASVVSAAPGLQVLALWDVEPFDLIVSDVHLPMVSGYDLIRVIREMERASGPHVLAISVTGTRARGRARTRRRRRI